jgi:hypothetical protein
MSHSPSPALEPTPQPYGDGVPSFLFPPGRVLSYPNVFAFLTRPLVSDRILRDAVAEGFDLFIYWVNESIGDDRRGSDPLSLSEAKKSRYWHSVWARANGAHAERAAIRQSIDLTQL